MAVSEALLKQSIRTFLEHHDLRVVDIPVDSAKTPDLLIEEDGQPVALIEIKQKAHDPRELESFLKEAEGGEVASRSRPIGYRNRLDGLVGSGVKQLIEKDATRSLLHLLWIYCEGRDADLLSTQLRATLFGMQTLFSTEVTGMVHCYYFWRSSFFKYAAGLDAVVIAQGDGAQMLLNEYSPRLEAVKASGLGRCFGAAVWFPKQYGIQDNVMICDCECPRNDQKAPLTYLRTKYRLDHLQTMNMGLHEAFIADHREDI